MSLPKVLLMLLVWLLYSIVAYKGCIEQCCTDDTGDEVTQTVTDSLADQAPTQYALSFNWDDPIANTNDGFDTFKERILAGMTDDNILEITGLYFEGEAKPDGFDNMGFARAAEIRKLFSNIPDDRIRFRARLEEETDDVKTNSFEAGNFDWIDLEKKDDAPAELEELADRVIIRFPSNSTTKKADPAVDDYLDKLANRVKTSSEKVSITGHADNVGSDETNSRLSRKRAEKVRDILVRKGVSPDQITVDFKGESQPVASNDTETGRQENRRAEVRLIKQ
jgi:outer membrane protein OmpA-like peptidoglycan-associated protein